MERRDQNIYLCSPKLLFVYFMNDVFYKCLGMSTTVHRLSKVRLTEEGRICQVRNILNMLGVGSDPPYIKKYLFFKTDLSSVSLPLVSLCNIQTVLVPILQYSTVYVHRYLKGLSFSY